MNRKLIGTVLVALQFALLAVLAITALMAARAGAVASGAWIVGCLGLVLGLWAVACNRPGNFNIHPMPRAGGALVQSGPYRWIRHPMYSAVLLVAAALAWVGAGAVGWSAVLLLGAVLAGKAVLEEQWMRAQHPGYALYQHQTNRFVPLLF